MLTTDPSKVYAQAYDIVLNGYELGGGSLRIHTREVQEQMFEALGFSRREMQNQFGFLLDALDYGFTTWRHRPWVRPISDAIGW